MAFSPVYNVSLLLSSQGVFIFFFHVIFNKEVRKNLKNVFTGKKTVPDESSTTRASLLTVSELIWPHMLILSYIYCVIAYLLSLFAQKSWNYQTKQSHIFFCPPLLPSSHPLIPASSAFSQLQQHVHRRRPVVPLGHRRVHRLPRQHAQVSQEPQQLPGLHSQVQHAHWLHGCFYYIALWRVCMCVCLSTSLFFMLFSSLHVCWCIKCLTHTNTSPALWFIFIYIYPHILYRCTHTHFVLIIYLILKQG